MPTGIPPNAIPWEYNNDAAGALTNVEMIAAAASKRRYVTHIFFNTVPGGTLKIMDASGGTVKFGTITLAANDWFFVDRSKNPIEIGQGKGAFVTTTGAGVQCVNVAGFEL